MSSLALIPEPPLIFRRLQTVRDWSYDREETTTEIFARGAGTCGSHGA